MRRLIVVVFTLALVAPVALLERNAHSLQQESNLLGDAQCNTISYDYCTRIPSSNRKHSALTRQLCQSCYPSLAFDFLAEERGLGNYLSYYYSNSYGTPPACP